MKKRMYTLLSVAIMTTPTFSYALELPDVVHTIQGMYGSEARQVAIFESILSQRDFPNRSRVLLNEAEALVGVVSFEGDAAARAQYRRVEGLRERIATVHAEFNEILGNIPEVTLTRVPIDACEFSLVRRDLRQSLVASGYYSGDSVSGPERIHFEEVKKADKDGNGGVYDVRMTLRVGDLSTDEGREAYIGDADRAKNLLWAYASSEEWVTNPAQYMARKNDVVTRLQGQLAKSSERVEALEELKAAFVDTYGCDPWEITREEYDLATVRNAEESIRQTIARMDELAQTFGFGSFSFEAPTEGTRKMKSARWTVGDKLESVAQDIIEEKYGLYSYDTQSDGRWNLERGLGSLKPQVHTTWIYDYEWEDYRRNLVAAQERIGPRICFLEKVEDPESSPAWDAQVAARPSVVAP